MKKIILISMLVVLTGCSTIKEYWPRSHDPAMFNNLVATDLAIENINCDQPDWSKAKESAAQVARYAEWRGDPQRENLKGLLAHTERMSRGGS